VDADARDAFPLELYFPVAQHRAGWTGDDQILVATAGGPRPPVAYTTRGERVILSAYTPPGTPVLALVPVETDFDRPERGPTSSSTAVAPAARRRRQGCT
jgi:hypothetical protein